MISKFFSKAKSGCGDRDISRVLAALEMLKDLKLKAQESSNALHILRNLPVEEVYSPKLQKELESERMQKLDRLIKEKADSQVAVSGFITNELKPAVSELWEDVYRTELKRAAEAACRAYAVFAEICQEQQEIAPHPFIWLRSQLGPELDKRTGALPTDYALSTQVRRFDNRQVLEVADQYGIAVSEIRANVN